MRTFTCHCGNKLHFENSLCMSCHRELGYLPDENTLSALEFHSASTYRALANGELYKSCLNYEKYDVCNWMIPAGSDSVFCQSCSLTKTIPNLGEEGNITLWYRVELAKRRLLYTLNQLNLPLLGRDVDPENGLAFHFLADRDESLEFNDELSPKQRVMTGHSAGTITINLSEADPSTREETREKMNERYRTLLGHFRHESGHYYWEKLVAGTPWIDEYRRLFGDERQDYQKALQRYYADGPLPDWDHQWISLYASAHPWEDFAETWAHYLHMVDTLETAHDYGFSVHGRLATERKTSVQYAEGYLKPQDIDALLEDWVELSVALNAMNRSMGLPDAYPFVLSQRVIEKLGLIHRLIHGPD